MNFILSLLDLLFGCHHPVSQRLGPFTDPTQVPSFPSDSRYSYVLCLKCGSHAEYSMDDFCVVTNGYLRRKRKEAKELEKENNHGLQSANQLPAV